MASSCPACPMRTVTPSSAPWPATRNIECRARDSFWTWRQAMYALANRIEPEDLQIVATQLFVEMLKAGYTSVAEFHYLHRGRRRTRYSGVESVVGGGRQCGARRRHRADVLADAVSKQRFRRPAAETGAGAVCIWTPTSSCAPSKSASALSGAARRATTAAHRRGIPQPARGAARSPARRPRCALRGIDPSMPVHIHVAEQMLEVRACERATGRRPIELLLDQELLDAALVRGACHARHARRNSRASPRPTPSCAFPSAPRPIWATASSTPRAFSTADGRLCVGSDSQSTVSPAEELRWLEYQQRLRKKRRGVLAAQARTARRHSAVARRRAERRAAPSANRWARSRSDCRADWLVLDAAHPSHGGRGARTPHWIACCSPAADTAIRDVMVGGRWVVKDRRHRRGRAACGADFGADHAVSA